MTVGVLASGGWDWWQFWNDSGAALIGGLAGGGIGAAVAFIVTGRTLKHDAQQSRARLEQEATQERERLRHATERARLAAEEERASQRAGLNRSVAMRLLQVLAEFVRWVPQLHIASVPVFRNDVDQTATDARRVIDMLIDEQQSNVLPLPLVARQRWEYLCRLAIDLGGLAAEPKVDWPDSRIRRAQSDVTNYVRFVRATLLAIIDEVAVPGEYPAPVLARNPNDGSSWHHPEEQNWNLGG
jgi:hypothetical protein